MLSLKTAATLLAHATGVDALAPLAAALGFGDTPLPLDREVRDGLGIHALVHDARIVRGDGTLRALLCACPGTSALRDTIAAIAARLTSHAPHLCWLVIATQPDGDGLAIASWMPDRNRPRIAALMVDRARVVASDAETVCALASAGSTSDVLTHAQWLEILGREALTRRFYRTLERVVGELADEASARAPRDDCQELALLHVSRLLFLSFLESKGWLDGNRRFLEHGFEECMAVGGGYHRRVLLPLCFGTLNTPPSARAAAARAFGRVPFLNGGLFARSALETRVRAVRFSDDAFGLVFGELLTRFRFTAREDSTTWSEAAIDPEMLGRAFESLMAARERRISGAFYTPQTLVASVARAALRDALTGTGVDAGQVEAALRGERIDGPVARLLHARIAGLRVLDPACGSGAFLVHTLEELASLAARLGDARPIAAIRRELLTRSIFGVDINRTAVWLCELRLWLSVVIESDERDPLAVVPLPNLDRHIRVGDSLAGAAFGDGLPPRGSARLAQLRARYARASGARKRTLERALDREERALALAHLDTELERNAARRRDLLAVLRGRDLFGERRRAASAERALLDDARLRARELRAARRALIDGGALPFAFVTHFPDAAAAAGFDVVIGNPPWVRLHRIPGPLRARLRARYAVFSGAAWQRGAAAAQAGAGFAAQVDLASLFVERSLALLRPGGTLALLLPAKLWRSLAGGGVRRLLHERAHVTALEDWSDAPPAFDAAVYPSLLVAQRADGDQRTARTNGASPTIAVTLHRKDHALHWRIEPDALALDADAASPWLAAPAEVRAAFDRLVRAGTPLSESALGRPCLGIKCGCNEAFAVRVIDRPDVGGADIGSATDGMRADASIVVHAHAPVIAEHGLATIQSGPRIGCIEHALLRPLLRGEHIARWTRAPSDECLIWTHGDDGAPIPQLPTHAERWLTHWQRVLAARSDAHGRAPWWALFRTATASSSAPRVVWADFGRAPRALVLPAGDSTIALNSCYVLPCRDLTDASAFAALLNSPLAAAWLHMLAEPARGGYKRYLAWTVALLPVPRHWSVARRLLAPLAERARRGDEVSDTELLDAALHAYRVRPTDVAPLIAWSNQ
ncbi:MAG TPA: DNA methyltransferase [Gemmatimonadaceae bacterium]